MTLVNLLNPGITILGSSARAAAQSAACSGFFVTAGDLFADSDLTDIAAATQIEDYPRGAEGVLRGPQSGGWMYTGALENHSRLIAAWQQLRPLWGNPASVVRRVRNPLRLAQVLRASGLPCPQIRLPSEGLPREGRWLIKAIRSAGGMHVAPLNPANPPSWADHKQSYLQERIEGVPVAAVYVASRGASVLVGVTEQLLGPPELAAQAAPSGSASRYQGSTFRYQGSIGPLPLDAEVFDRFDHLGNVLTRAFDLVGLFGVDAILNDDGVWPVEVNPRYTASVEVIERATGAKAIACHHAACELGQLPEAHPTPRHWSGKRIVYAPAPLQFPGREQLRDDLLTTAGVARLADIPHPQTIIHEGWPIATVLADEVDRPSLVAALDRQAAALLAACRAIESP